MAFKLKPSSKKDQNNILTLSGEIDLHNSPAVAASLKEIIARKPPQVLVDLSQVSYIDSSGIAVMIEGMQNVQKYGGKFGIFGIQDSVRSIFEIARLDQVFRIFPDLKSASAAA
jgi:anti-sigma B factor antagonist